MTKETYFEMCEALGSVPKEDEIPIEYDDLPPEVHTAFAVYDLLKDEWDYFNGNYFGKVFTGITEVFDILEIPRKEWKEIYEIVLMIDKIKTQIIQSKKKSVPDSKPLK